MINDPLLQGSGNTTDEPSTWAPPTLESVPSVPRTDVTPAARAASRPTTPTPRRRRHPAVSARILAVGISTSAMFAMTAAYASAERTKTPQPVGGDASLPSDTPSGTSDGTSSRSQGQQPTPGRAAPRQNTAGNGNAASQQSDPGVVVVPVDPVAPAVPGNVGGNPQQSSGSN